MTPNTLIFYRRIACVSSIPALLLSAVATASGPDPDLESLVQQYAAVESVRIEAAVEVLIHGDDPSGPSEAAGEAAGQRINGEYQYLAEDGKYRILSRLDSDVFSSIDTEVAFDGETFQLLRNDRSVLSFGSGDRDIGTVTLPNPFLAILSFLYPQDDATWEQAPKLQDAALTEDVEQLISSVEWSPQLIDNRELDTASFPGAMMEGVPYTFRVGADTAVRSEPLRIDYVSTETGNVIASIAFSHFRAADQGGEGQRWPRVVEFRAYQGNGDPLATLKYVVLELEIDQPYPGQAYWIDLNEADALWSDDLQMFLN